MINKVEIFNFQSHKHTSLDFVDGTNVIIGKSDTGKSAIFRAINWVCSNRPLGDAYRSEWGGDTKVVLYTSEGNVVQRVKTNSRNEYIINDLVLTAFGYEVPDEVQNVLQMDFANIQSQMDKPFLLSSTPGEAAKLLNKAASIDDIDITMGNLKRNQNKINETINHNETQLEKYNKDIKSYNNIPLFEEKYNELYKKNEVYQDKRDKNNKIFAICSGIDEVNIDLESTKNVDVNLSNLKKLNKIYSDFVAQKERMKLLKNVILKITTRQEEIEKLKDVDDKISTINSLEKSIKSFNEKSEKTAKLEKLIAKISRINRTITGTKNSENVLEKEYKNLAPEKCPLCGNNMKTEKYEKPTKPQTPE